MEKHKIYDLDYMGRGICKIDNKVGFIENALLDEIAEIEVSKEKKNFFIGKSITIDNENNNRRIFNCKYYNECGGCDIAHMNYDYQLNFKKTRLVNELKNIAKEDNINVQDVIKSEELYYRNKITLKVNKDKIGFYKKNSYDIVDINKCLLSNNNINLILSKLSNFIKNYENHNISEIIIKSDIETMINIKSNNFKLKEKLISELKNLKINSILINDKKIYKKESIYFELLNKKFIVSSNSFFQINKIQTENLYKKILELSDLNKNDIVLDLYCGVGTISIFLSEYCKKVIGIEVVKDAVLNANKNNVLNNIKNVEFIISKVENIIDKIQDKIELIVLDPPRSGCDKKTIESLLKINTKRIIYVSCNPATLARDLNELKINYNIEIVIPFDMFPNTHHIETLVIMNRLINLEDYK